MNAMVKKLKSMRFGKYLKAGLGDWMEGAVKSNLAEVYKCVCACNRWKWVPVNWSKIAGHGSSRRRIRDGYRNMTI
jgi:hypothetical protein